MNSTFLNKVVYFCIVFVVIGLVVSFFNDFLEKTWVHNPTYEESPEQYEFVVFPINSNTLVYSEKDFNTPLTSLNRAIGTSPSEIKDGAVAINLANGDYGYVKMSSLSYLPPNGDQLLLKNMQEYFITETGVEIIWSSTQNPDGTYTINYTIEDDDHARSNTYSYVTDGQNLIKVYQSTSKSGILSAAMLIYDIPVILVLIVLASILKRRILRKT